MSRGGVYHVARRPARRTGAQHRPRDPRDVRPRR